MGVSYKDAIEMSAGLGDCLLAFHKEVKEYESDQMELQTKNMKNGRF